ncbi:LacI family DNA-binding transcriptional regulator [Consotaella salsifontis]|uniref:DNA-binding transcriptional regulator, LacI/PurR family n=1 Tax=Consotaella salsifontis TaxID=1365950 RepID=A0A1T4SI10_9HYPH|nr:LacI family DNA-binding transcriptional regulator [Consotaella salsifontis]SKA27852.1 DNA-binding transcriptional regulator, LacI/PurR family [Consotaella salsifontis]
MATKKPKIRTMEELASAIAVSRPTLSRFFQDPESVRPATAEKIRQGLAHVDYVPNFFATRMNRRASGLVGVIVPLLTDPFFASLLQTVELAALEMDFTVITQCSHGSAELEANAVERLLSMNTEGVVVAPLGEYGSADALRQLGRSLPIVFVDSRPAEPYTTIDFVGTDNEQSIGLITDYLCRTGAPPVYLGMPRLNSNGLERESAYRRWMAGHDLRPEVLPDDLAPQSWAFETYAYQTMDALFGQGLYVDATILCANDRLAMGALQAAHRHGLFNSRPGARTRVRIAGHDDHPLSRFMTPALTTVAQDIDTIGMTAMSLLASRIRSGKPGEETVERTFPAALKIRESA